MRFNLEYPIANASFSPEFATRDGMVTFATTAEAQGYDGIAFTEHPAPSLKWLQHGGHQNLDPIAAMSFCAAVTQTLTVMPFLLVLPYRNPLLTAKSMASVDLLSDGRAVAVCGTGYLRSEFRSLGVQFDERNELFDEALEVMRGVWSQDPFDYKGRHFEAVGVTGVPLPSRPGGPPIWIGGNSAAARRRAALNEGWSPIMVSAEVAKTSRTSMLADVDQLRRSIKQVKDLAVELRGDDATVDIQVLSPECRWVRDRGTSVEEHRDHLGQLSEAGVDWFVLKPSGESVRQSLDEMAYYAETFLNR